MTRVRVLLIAGSILPALLAAQAPTVPPRPTPGPAPSPRFPTLVLDTLPNGMRITVVEDHELPLVTVRIGVTTGNFEEPAGKEGLFILMGQALREGTTTRTPAQIADAAADLGVAITFDVPYTYPRFTAVRSSWEAALYIAADEVMHPAFPAEAVARLKGGQLNSIARPQQDTRASQLLYRTIFGDDNASGRMPTEASIQSLTREDVVGFHQRFVRPQNAYIVVAGDVTRREAKAAVLRAFGSWERGGTTVAVLPRTVMPYTGATTVFLLHDPTSTATVAAGELLPDRASAAGTALEVIGPTIGTLQLAGRLYHAFREERGLSYAPSAAPNWRLSPQPGYWTFNIRTVPVAKADTAVTELVRLIRELNSTRPLTQEELDFGKRNRTGGLLRHTETTETLAAAAFDIMRLRMPGDFFATLPNRLNAVTLEEARGVTAKMFDAAHMPIIVVGDTTVLGPSIRATGIPVVVVSH